MLAYVGHTEGWDETIVDGDAEMGAIAELMRAAAMPDPGELRAGGVDLVERAGQVG